VRSVQDLTSVDDPAWPVILEWVQASPRPVRVLPPPTGDRGRCLRRLQVTVRSPLGALAWESGGLVLDDGWLRMLGGGSAGLPDVATASGLDEPAPESAPPPLLIVAQDVLGGLFAVNGGGLAVDLGEVAYFGPDTLDWTGLGAGHTQFLEWTLIGDTRGFYEDLRWPGWREEVAAVGLDQGLSVYPPLFSAEGSRDVGATSRRPVPWAEIVEFNRSAAEQLNGPVR
jgi:hypothetical protein